jgi:predicted unusual protein kinase regulating ubiquinone biosynthesis (AarF/ABC1/UbiB family)
MILPAADADGIASEVSSMILGELDLAKEAENLKLFAELFADDPDIIIPKVYPLLSGTDYLTMDYIEGMKKSDFILEVDESRRQRASNTIIRFYAKSFAVAGIMNCDPHPGNFIFKSDGRVAFIDFGSCRAWNKAMIEKILETLAAHLDGSSSRKIAAWQNLGYGVGQPSFDFSAHIDEMDRVLLPIMPGPYEGGHGAFTFTKSYVENMQNMQLQGLSNRKLLAPAPETTFMVRISFGLLDVLADPFTETEAHWPYREAPPAGSAAYRTFCGT